MTTTIQLPGGTWTLGDRTVSRFGYGAMQLAGPWVVGPPKDHDAAIAVLRAAVASGITHIDTAETYGPRVVNELIREALHPYASELFIATKSGGRRDAQGGWPAARKPDELKAQIDDNLETLGVDVLDLVHLRLGDANGPVPEQIGEAFETLVGLQ
jgi:pyridoxine 4-dehydrogenase